MANTAATQPGARVHFGAADFDQLMSTELEHLGLPRQDQLCGLALSGGGIRSASFALGVLQALYGFRVFDRFHYLSTVSGGGYIGSALTYFRNAFPQFGNDWFPFGYLGQAGARRLDAAAQVAAKPDPAAAEAPRDAVARKIVSFLRQHASFLTPSRQLNNAALGAGVIRGLVSTVVPYFLMLAGLLGLLMHVGFFDGDAAPFGLPPIAMDEYVAPEPLPGCLECERPGKPAPAMFLAAWPAYAAIGLIGLILVVFFASSLVAGLFNFLDRREVHAERGYLRLIILYSRTGLLLLIAGFLLSLATVPWVHAYLHHLSGQMDSRLPSDFASLIAALAGAAGLVGKLRGILGGNATEPSRFRAIWMSIAGLLFVYGLLLLAYGAAKHWTLPHETWLWAAACLAFGAIAGLIININLANQHRIYRDRLMEVFCADEDALMRCRWRPARRAQGEGGWIRNMTNPPLPYQLINTCLVTTDSDDRRFRGRGGDNFILSPLYCGSDATGWVRTDAALPTLTIATAAAISGAALNAHTGPHGTGLLRSKAYAALLSFLGLNLGFWAPNPARFHNRTATNLPWFYIPNLLKPGLSGLTGRNINEEGSYVQLSDGGHFENLAIYELIRRKVRFLWVSDAGQDVGFTFEDLSSAIERVRVDFGVNIRFREPDYDLSHLIPGSIAAADNPADQNFFERYNVAKRGYAVGTIEYPGMRPQDYGIIVYVKSTLTTGLPGDIYGYKARNDDFPHQTTLDQFFDEEQFEAYRELGYRLSAQLFRDIEKFKDAKASLPPALDEVSTKLSL